jgi:hypothetical protein
MLGRHHQPMRRDLPVRLGLLQSRLAVDQVRPETATRQIIPPSSKRSSKEPQAGLTSCLAPWFRRSGREGSRGVAQRFASCDISRQVNSST